jgi:murein DD-endopeptidase MepM/ murein hydrolase activator NlpD
VTELHQKYHIKKPRQLHKGKWKSIVFIFIVLGLSGFFVAKKIPDIRARIAAMGADEEIVHNEEQQSTEEQLEEIVEEDLAVHCTVEEGDIPAEIFSEYGHFDANDTAAIIDASEDVFDLTHLKIGRPLRFYFDDENDPERATRMEYDCNTEEMIVVERDGDNFSAQKVDIAYEVTEEIAEGTIENFFYVDALDAGLSEATVLDVGDIFSFSIDFTTEIRQGDAFVFVYEKRTRNGEKAPDGYIRAAKFVNDGTAHYAYYFDNDGEGGYYDGDGHALERQFLKAPLSYRQITSGFTGARLHPITRKVSAHYQIDYAAPTGTPVVASARGTVTSAGWEGGWGNIVRMRHDNGYTTHYAHLSAFAKGISSGTHVAQGEVIGYVGSTGWSTGPHLDYGMRLNGAPVNPLTLVQPKGAPLEGEKMEQFKEMKEGYAEILQ